MKNLLLIVDMQRSFTAANKKATVKACQELIFDAISLNNSIVFLEYKWNGKTKRELTSLVRNYSFVNTIQKEDDDGSEEVISFFNKCKFVPKNIIVGGVNTNFCVRQTVLGLAEKNDSKLFLVQDACNHEYGDAEHAIKEMKRAGVKII